MVTLRTYWDGSGKSDNPRSKIMVLGGFAAENPFWADFDDQWNSILENRGDPGYLHMSEATSFSKAYAGWNEDQVSFLLEGLTALLQTMPRQSPVFHGFRCTVDLAAHKHLRLHSKKRFPSPERICARWALSMLLEWRSADYPERTIEKIDLFFDRNEGFLRHLHRDWTDKKIRERYPFYEVISTMAPVKMRDTPGVQAADLLAWSTAYRLNRQGVIPWQNQIARDAIKAVDSWHLYFDAKRLEEHVNGLAPDYFSGLPPSW